MYACIYICIWVVQKIFLLLFVSTTLICDILIVKATCAKFYLIIISFRDRSIKNK